MEFIYIIADDHGMTGVVAPLIPNDGIRFFAVKISYFAFAFIAPLRADNN
jgi:hypothetical protein